MVRRRFPPIPVPSGSGVGAGDAMVAGITAGLARGWALDKAVQLGTAAGAAMLLTPGTAACALADVERLLGQAAEPIVVELTFAAPPPRGPRSPASEPPAPQRN